MVVKAKSLLVLLVLLKLSHNRALNYDGYPKRAILEKISESDEISGLSVTVIYDKREDRDEWASDFCQEKGWNYKDYFDMMGCEDECIIAMDCPVPEAASRPHNSYLICTNIIIE